MNRTLLVSVLLLVLVETFTEGAPAKNCRLSQYTSLIPQDLQAFKDFIDKYRETVQDTAMTCSASIFCPKQHQLPVCQNFLLLLEKTVDLTIRVIQNLSEPELVRNASRPLQILARIREDLRSCIQLKGLDHDPAAQLPFLIQLQKSHAGKSEGSARCLERTLIFNLYCLLKEDLQGVANRVNEACRSNPDAVSRPCYKQSGCLQNPKGRVGRKRKAEPEWDLISL